MNRTEIEAEAASIKSEMRHVDSLGVWLHEVADEWLDEIDARPEPITPAETRALRETLARLDRTRERIPALRSRVTALRDALGAA